MFRLLIVENHFKIGQKHIGCGLFRKDGVLTNSTTDPKYTALVQMKTGRKNC